MYAIDICIYCATHNFFKAKQFKIKYTFHFGEIFKKHKFYYSLGQASDAPFILSYFKNLFKDVFNKSKDQFTCDIHTKL